MPLGPINVIPAGFLSLLGLKEVGQNPAQVLDLVQSTIDLREFFLVRQARSNEGVLHQITFTTGAGALSGFVPAITVPGDELWYVHEFTVGAVVPAVAGDTITALRAALIYNIPGTIEWTAIGDIPMDCVGIAAYAKSVASTARNFWAPPGGGLGVAHGGVTSIGGVVVTGKYRVTKLKI